LSPADLFGEGAQDGVVGGDVASGAAGLEVAELAARAVLLADA
jgi:hypothetical protein